MKGEAKKKSKITDSGRWLHSDFAFGLYAGLRILLLIGGLIFFTESIWPTLSPYLSGRPYLSSAQGRRFVRFFGGVLFLVGIDRLYFFFIGTIGLAHFNLEKRLATIEKMSGLFVAMLGGLFIYFGIIRLIQLLIG